MTEYWQSTGRKFCEICKVWYADNKISSERHEMGNKHKAMVQQRIRESGKKAAEQEKERIELQLVLSQMEQAAAASCREDDREKKAQQRRPPQVTSTATGDTWKTSERTLCPVCKVWIANTKGAFEMHERGQQHQSLLKQHYDGVEWQKTIGTMKVEPSVSYWSSWTPNEKEAQMNDQTQIECPTESNRAPSSPSLPTTELTKAERKRIKRERAEQSAAEGPPPIPEGLVEISIPVKRERNEVDDCNLQSSDYAPKDVPTIDASASSSTSASLLGPWIPVQKDKITPVANEEEKQPIVVKKSDSYNDLPEQHYGNSLAAKRPEELIELANIDPQDLEFKPKTLEATKKAKVVEFRKPKRRQ